MIITKNNRDEIIDLVIEKTDTIRITKDSDRLLVLTCQEMNGNTKKIYINSNAHISLAMFDIVG